MVDLFAGPGGLGEGFAAFVSSDGQPVFKIVLSIEKDDAAHSTLELRSFFRQFPRKGVPLEYYQHIQGLISREQLYAAFPIQTTAAKNVAWKVTLGEVATGCAT